MARRKRRGSLSRRYNPKRRRTVFFIACGVLLACGLGYLLFTKAIPALRTWIGTDPSENALPEVSTAPYGDYTDKIRELLLTTQYRNIGIPVMHGDTIYFTGGMDQSGNPRLSRIIKRDVQEAGLADEFKLVPIKADVDGLEKAAGDILKNDNIINIDVSNDYIAYFDGKRAGGGTICVYRFSDQRITEMKEVYYGSPEVKIAGDHIIWTERTGKNTDKLYMMNINDKELTTLAVFEESPYGLSQPDASDDLVVWADYDAEHPNSTEFSVIKVRSIPYDESKSIDYKVDMYVHDPVINGGAIAWVDGNGGKDSTLYLSVDGASPKKIAEGVSYHGLGKDYVAWCSDGTVWAYFWAEDKAYRMSKQSELALLASVSDYGIIWFDITDVQRTQDIVKFVQF